MKFFATTPKGLELLLVDELRALGATDAAEKLAGVVFSGELALAYKACLWSRLANRILLHLTDIPAKTPEELYAGIQTIPWHEHLDPSGTLSVNFISVNSEITHTLYGAQKVKDAIVDQLRDQFEVRPDVARDRPDVAIYIYLNRNMASVNIDLSGESLHRRGYRLEQGEAPIKENLAAAILVRAKWKAIADAGGSLVDPMCGSGTFLVEAALMAGDIAPGLLRDYFGFLHWKKHDAPLWASLLQEAQLRREQGANKIPKIVGYDADPRAIQIAFSNIERAGFTGKIHVEKRELADCSAGSNPTGLLVTNPPYGERLGEMDELPLLYQRLGEKLKQEFIGWEAAVFTGNPEFGKKMGIRSRKYYALFNGTIPCQLLLFSVQREWFVDNSPKADNERRVRRAQKELSESDRETVAMFVNRLQKKLKHLKKWAKRENVTCYRIYDADLPEYAVLIDLYDDSLFVQVYPEANTLQAEKRIQCVLAVLTEATGVFPANIFFKEYREPYQLPAGFPKTDGKFVSDP